MEIVWRKTSTALSFVLTIIITNLNSFEFPLHRLEFTDQSFALLDLPPDHYHV